MKVLDWNILASEWIDDKTYNEVKKAIRHNNKHRFKCIFHYIINQDAALILLQEVMPYEYKKLKILFNDNYIITPLCRINWDKNKNNSGNVTLFKRSEFSDEYMNHARMEFGIHTTCVYKNKPCNIYNIHLSDNSAQYRYTQLNSIMNLLLESKTCIVGGDFNHHYIKGTKFYDIPNYIIHNTTCPTYYIGRKLIIDNILTKGFRLSKSISCPICPICPTSIENGLLKYGSDHLPLMLNIV